MIKTTKKTRKMETINNLLNEGLKDFRQNLKTLLFTRLLIQERTLIAIIILKS